MFTVFKMPNVKHPKNLAEFMAIIRKESKTYDADTGVCGQGVNLTPKESKVVLKKAKEDGKNFN